jgi:hypothetical protein
MDLTTLGWSDLLRAPGKQLEHLLSIPSSALLPTVDTEVLSPIGFIAAPTAGDVEIDRDVGGDTYEARANGSFVARFPVRRGLTDQVIGLMRDHRAVLTGNRAHDGPYAYATFLAQAACAALPVACEDLDPITRSLLDDDLVKVLSGASQVDLADPLQREQYAMALHREAYRAYRIRRSAAAGEAPTVSILANIDRPELFPQLLCDVAAQEWPRIELVVTLRDVSKSDLPIRTDDFPHELVVLGLDSQSSPGRARNVAVSAASGDLLATMEADSWYGCHHVTDLAYAIEYAQVALTCSPARFIYLVDLDLTVHRQQWQSYSFASSVAPGAMLIRRDTLAELGGWPQSSDDRGSTLVAERAIAAGHRVYCTHGLEYVRCVRAATICREEALRQPIQQWPGFHPPLNPGSLTRVPPSERAAPESWFRRLAR